MRIATIVLGVLLLVPACSSKSGSGGSCDAPTNATTVELRDFTFSPTCLETVAGATINVTNTGATTHSFTVTSADINVDLGAGQSKELDIEQIDPGTYDVTCSYHPQMIGSLKIVSASS